MRYALARREPELLSDLVDIEQRVAEPEERIIGRTVIDDDPISDAAPYYWVIQNNSPEEIEEGFLQAQRDDVPHHDLRKLEPGDTVFNCRNGEILGHSTVASHPHLIEEDGTESLRVEVEFRPYSEPLQFADGFSYLSREDVRLDTYYPIHKTGINQQYLFNLSAAAGEYLLRKGDRQQDPDRLEERLSMDPINLTLPENLYYPPEQARQLQSQITAAINSGKHVVFTGPPGTGKSKLALTEHPDYSSRVDANQFVTIAKQYYGLDPPD